MTREAAIARLTVIGSRAVDRLIAAATDERADTDPRTAAWRTLDAIRDARAIDPALRTLASKATPPPVAVAAAASTRAFITGPRGAEIVDRLTELALDRSRADEVRVAALRLLRGLDRTTIAPLLASVADDPSAAVREEAADVKGPRNRAPRAPQSAGADQGDASAFVVRAAEQALPDDPAPLRAAVHRAGARVALPVLLGIVERVREREGGEPPARRAEWRLVRAAAHQALADRGSRLALYDLRESLEMAKGTLPVEFLPPLGSIGDASCLEAIAAAHASTRDAWLRRRLTDAFFTIVAREKLTQRDAVMKRIAKRWPAWSPRRNASEVGRRRDR